MRSWFEDLDLFEYLVDFVLGLLFMLNFDILVFSIFSCWMNLGRAPLLWHCFRVTDMLFDVLVCFEGLSRKRRLSGCCLLFGWYGWSWIPVCFKNPLALDLFWQRVMLVAVKSVLNLGLSRLSDYIP